MSCCASIGAYEGRVNTNKITSFRIPEAAFLSMENRAQYRRVKACYNGEVYLYRPDAKTCLQLKYKSVQQGKKGHEKRGLEKPSLIFIICQNVAPTESEPQ